jgi:hypothetical protein
MIDIDSHISNLALNFFKENIKSLSNYISANTQIKTTCGINEFFTAQIEATELLEKIKKLNSIVSEPNRREYGDFQTNSNLASQITEYAISKNNNFEFVLEPTCGKGNFILALLKHSKSLKKIVGVEIYQPYVWETKFKILTYFLENRDAKKPEIDIIHSNVFEFSYEKLANSTKHLNTLVIGNPPWVTNSELGSIDSKNLPKKSNFKKHKGFEALTGKGNFDIGEYISMIMLNCFQNHNGIFAFLIKNSVVKNLIQDQKRNCYKIGQSERLNIDSKKEFNVSVNASLFLTRFNNEPEFTCKEFDFYSREHITTFGWYKNKFVYSVQDYDKSSNVDGKSIFTWRSGVKHDCSKVMEFESVNGHYTNGLGEDINLEKNLIYGLLKSSDLKNNQTNTFRKQTIITQKKIGQETSYIKDKFPLTFQYLISHREHFEKRKSSIYKGKPDFSIFGIGEYSFAPYKIGISGLYKSTHFTLIKPDISKPVMLDDTCYFIGFNELIFAQIAHFLVNSVLVQRFLKSIIFSDSKRSINKDILMRIDFERAFENSDFKSAKKHIQSLSIYDWTKFGKMIKKDICEQMKFF